MASRGGNSRKARRGKGAKGVEWVGGVVSMPAYVTGEGEPYRPDALVWLDPDGMVLGATTARPGELLGTAGAALAETIKQPMHGQPHAPARVRVASADLADAVRAEHPGIEVVCRPTPELEVFAQVMMQAMAEPGAEPGAEDGPYLLDMASPEACEAMFSAAAALHRAAPWDLVPSDQDLFSVTIEALDVHESVISVIGQMGQNYGVILFASLEDFEEFVSACTLVEDGDEPSMPPHLDLNYETAGGIPVALRREIEEHDWEVAAADAYAWPVAVDPDVVPRPPTSQEITTIEAIALALPKALRQRKALRTAWEGGKPFAKTVTVQTQAGELEVTLRAPCEMAFDARRPTDALLAELFDLAEGAVDEPIDPDARGPLEDELVRRFQVSPEAMSLKDVEMCGVLMDFAADYLDATISTLSPADLRVILFEVFPRKLSARASEAPEIVETLRAFYAFLDREHGLEQAGACLDVLGGDAASRLERALGDPRNFGMAKSFLMAGYEAGYDMDTGEGVQAWLEASQGKPFPALEGSGPTLWPAPSEEEAGQPKKSKKKKRKASRKARRKNR